MAADRNKNPSIREGGLHKRSPLIFQSRCRIWHPIDRAESSKRQVQSSKLIDSHHQLVTRHSSLVTFSAFQGCRGFIGPVPPPLWIRAAYLIIAGNNKRVAQDCQVAFPTLWTKQNGRDARLKSPPSHAFAALIPNLLRLIGRALAGIIRRTGIRTQPEDCPCHRPNAADLAHGHAASTALWRVAWRGPAGCTAP
jgi:hypothetical protein